MNDPALADDLAQETFLKSYRANRCLQENRLLTIRNLRPLSDMDACGFFSHCSFGCSFGPVSLYSI
ncbi:MAG: hypothetical protein JXR49_19140 [Acidobacteria bacterium]|nr:hypothetical protein [Acidobacteriota bacterium]